MARYVITRTISSLTRQARQPVSFTPEGAVSISYPTLVSSPLSLQAAIGYHLLRTLKDLSNTIIQNKLSDLTPNPLASLLSEIYLQYTLNIVKGCWNWRTNLPHWMKSREKSMQIHKPNTGSFQDIFTACNFYQGLLGQLWLVPWKGTVSSRSNIPWKFWWCVTRKSWMANLVG